MIQDKIFFDEKDPTGLSYNTPFTYYGSYQGRLWSKSPSGSIQYYTQNSDLSVYATTGSNQFSGSQTVTGSLTVTGTITGTVAGTTSTASYVEYTNVANKPALISGSAQIASFGIFATTGSNGFNGSQSITGSLTVTGQVVAQTLNVQQVTSSIVYSSGSNIFGNSLANIQQFTGSVGVTGSLTVNTSGVEFQVTNTGVNLGNALTDSHIISGSLRVNPNGLFVSGSGIVGVGTILPSERFEVNTGQGARAGMALTGEYPYLRFNVSSSSANARNWAFNATNAEPGDFALLQSTAKDGNPVTAGTSILGFSRTGAATFSSRVGVGGASATYSLTAYNASNGTTAAFGGTARGIRIDNDGTFSSGRSTIYGVDNTFYGSYQPLAIGGSELYFSISGTDRLTIASTGAATFNSSVTAAGVTSTATSRFGSSTNYVSTFADGGGVYFENTGTSTATRTLRIQGINDAGNAYTQFIISHGAGNIRANINDQERIRIDGDGLKFNGDTAAANALDDYEEGTWTPVIRGSGTAGTYELSTPTYSTYTKIGRQVTVSAQIQLQGSITGGGTGYMQITGLPFTKANNMVFTGAVQLNGVNFTGQFVSIKFVTVSPSTVIYLAETVDNGGSIDLPISAISAGNGMAFTITYFE